VPAQDGARAVPESPRAVRRPRGRGLHSSTIQLNVSAFCGIGGACMGHSGGVSGYEGVTMVYLVSETAQVELKSGRV
jgi:hypothetical protein